MLRQTDHVLASSSSVNTVLPHHSHRIILPNSPGKTVTFDMYAGSEGTVFVAVKAQT